MKTYRAIFDKNIICEFAPPFKNTKSVKVIILCDGAPSVPSKKSVIEFWTKKGFWVFHPRYRGTWESGGKFLKRSPSLDILNVIKQLPKGFTYHASYVQKRSTKINYDKLYLIGGSFGGPAVILASQHKEVTKAVAFCPVVDWKKLGRAEPLNEMSRFFKEAFGEGYRFNQKDWNKLKSGKFYNPVSNQKNIDGSKLFIIQSKDDESVFYKPVEKFAKNTGSKLWLIKTGGHIGHSNSIKPKYYNKIRHFFLKKD